MQNDQRFYFKKAKTRETLGAKLKEIIKELALKKHIRVRKQVTEGKKIRDIEEALAESLLLREIDPETDEFEKLTED